MGLQTATIITAADRPAAAAPSSASVPVHLDPLPGPATAAGPATASASATAAGRGFLGAASWAELGQRQCGIIARHQLRDLGIGADYVRRRIATGRWKSRSATVISTFTGELTDLQRCWLGVLHAGGSAGVGGLTATAMRGLKRWGDDAPTTILVDHRRRLEPIPGISFWRTRRPLGGLIEVDAPVPLCRLDPALLLTAAYRLSKRSAQGLLAAAVQQKLTSVEQLAGWLELLSPLHRSPLFRTLLDEIAGGAQSLGEVDVARMCESFNLPRPSRQVQRRDAAGVLRFTDCEWRLDDGQVVILEVDGGFHMEIGHWEADIARERALVDVRRHVVRCTARELRDTPSAVASDLARLGVRRAVGRVGPR